MSPRALSSQSIETYDTTLRDGSQGEGISFSVRDKFRIAEKLDWLGVQFIEAGWPGSNPKDMAFFKEYRSLKLKRAEIVAFGSTRRAHTKAAADPNLRELVKAGTRTVTIFGKSWDLHVRDVFKAPLDENLRMIDDSVRFLRDHGKTVIYDAEHFFDGYKSNSDYAVKTCVAAAEAGARTIVLCDTNGGTVPSEVAAVISKVRRRIALPIGIHTHNDSGMAIANAIAAVESGATQVQGTINGCGERCGNPDLIAIIATLQLKLGRRCLPPENLKRLTETSRFVAEVANMFLQDNQPYVGKSAFAHKGGVHINAVQKNTRTYEHIRPEEVGNVRRFLTSELMGKTNITLKAETMGLRLPKNSPQTQKILRRLQELENEGYQFEAAEASFELLIHEMTGRKRKFFELIKAKVSAENIGDKDTSAEASIRLKVGKKPADAIAVGDGPVNALDKALRKALVPHYPALGKMHLSDFKVRVLDQKAGTAAKVRVFIESRDETGAWTTVGISTNIIEASWQALVASIEYKLLKTERRG